MTFVDKSSLIPFYLQLANVLRNQINSGVFDAKTLLPSERELCNAYDVSRSTVRQAIQVLKEEGLISKERGVGTRIKQRPVIEQDLLGYHNFDLQMQEKGYTATAKILGHDVLKDGGRVQRLMGLPREDRIFKAVRLRLVGNEPIFIEKIYMPLKRFPNLKIEDFSKTDIFLNQLGRKYDLALGDARVFIEPVVLEQMEQDILEIEQEPAVGLLFERISYNKEGNAVAVTKRVFGGERCRHLLVLKAQ